MSASTGTPAHRPLRGILSLFIVGLIAVGASLATATPALAHDELIGSNPAADAVVTEVPTQITLTFGAELIGGEGATEVQVLDSNGLAVGVGDAVTDGTEVTQPLAADLANGAYRVLWKVVSSDGHPTAGEFAFTLNAAGSTPTTAPSDSESAPATTDPSADPSADPSESDSTEASTTETPTTEDTAAASAVPWVIFGIIAVAIIGAVVYLLVARARRKRDLEAAQAGAADAASGPGDAGGTESGTDAER